ncbi:MAG: methionine synthase, partial [Nocardioides sp.]
LIVQVDEAALDAVINARIPTASGYGRHRSIDLPEASQALQWVLEAIADEGAEPWVHSCAAATPWDLVRGAGARGLAVDMAQLTARDLDHLAAALEAGETVALGAVPSLDPEDRLSDKQVTEQVLRWLDMVGLDPHEVSLAITPSCGMAGASVAWSRRAMALARTSAGSLSG